MSENKVYLEREAVINKTRDLYEYEYPTASGDFDEYVTRLLPNALLNMKPSDVKPVVRGEWERHWNIKFGWVWKCSSCGQENFSTYKFCPNCGAEMRKEETR